MQADVALELRVLHLAGNRKSTDCHTEGSLSKRDLRKPAPTVTVPPTRTHLLIVPLPLGAIFFFKPPHRYRYRTLGMSQEVTKSFCKSILIK